MKGSSKFEIADLDPSVYRAIKDLKINEISEPFKTKDKNNYDVYKIVQLKSKTSPHKANLEDDYQLIQDITLAEKQQKFLDEWVVEKRKSTYIKINDEYKNCGFLPRGFSKTQDR